MKLLKTIRRWLPFSGSKTGAKKEIKEVPDEVAEAISSLIKLNAERHRARHKEH